MIETAPSLAELFKRQERSEKALVLALMQMVLQGVSTRRVKEITTELCGREFSRQTVSNLTERLGEQVQAWAERPLEEEYPFLLADAMQIDVRRQGAVRSTTATVVVGISEEGYREILGFKIALSETGESWKELFEDLKARGLQRVELATSDAHEGLEAALRSAFPGCIWQRCQAHFRRNVLDKTPAGYRDRMHELLDQILEADSQQQAQQRLEQSAEELEEKAPAALNVLEKGLFEATAVLALPEKYRRRLRTSKRAATTHPGGAPAREGNPHFSKQGLSLATDWSLAGRKTRGVVNWTSLSHDGRVLRVAREAGQRTAKTG
ncbi:transposase-like protein [Salinibacter ruber]|nr:transposase-like protein [Salinibacter ruber]